MIEPTTTHEETEPQNFAALLQAAVASGFSDVELNVAGMTSLPDDLAQLQGMESVAFYNCGELVDIAVFQRYVFPRLKAIALLGDSRADCEKHDHLDASAAARLARCAAQGTPRQLLDLSPLRHIAGLARLQIQVDQAVELEFLRYLPGLVELQLTNAWVRDFSPIGALVQLRELGLHANGHLQDLSFLAQSATVLASLSVSYCAGLCDASALVACTALEILSLNATALQVLSLPQAPQSLKILDLRSQSELASVEGLGGQACLQLIAIIGCGRLVELPVSGDLPTLAFLTICNCAELKSVGALASSALVERVLLVDNPLLARFPVCGDLARLQSLHLISPLAQPPEGGFRGVVW